MNEQAAQHIHFMGIGGIGVSALAGICLARGITVTGCDREENEQTRLIQSLGGSVQIGHSPDHLAEVDRLVYTSAVAKDHPELLAAGNRAVRRGSFLAELMQGCKAAGVCGTHGKTTTSWMLSHILIHCGMDPTVVLGGSVSAMGGNFRTGGELFVCELDESDGSFLEPQLNLALITNVESEHLSYYGSLEKVVHCFAQFSDNSNGPELLVACLDDPVAASLYEKRAGRKIGYGLNDKREVYAEPVSGSAVNAYTVYRNGEKAGVLTLPFPGKHNVLNALGAFAAAVELGASEAAAIDALNCCPGIGRRMEYIGKSSETRFYSDYAHHPSEVAAAISAARELAGDGKLLVAFQPHLYSRTRDYYKKFAQALSQADAVVLADIYAAREKPIDGVDSTLIAKALESQNTVLHGPVAVEQINGIVAEHCADYAVVVYMGAGSIDRMVRGYGL